MKLCRTWWAFQSLCGSVMFAKKVLSSGLDGVVRRWILKSCMTLSTLHLGNYGVVVYQDLCCGFWNVEAWGHLPLFTTVQPGRYLMNKSAVCNRTIRECGVPPGCNLGFPTWLLRVRTWERCCKESYLLPRDWVPARLPHLYAHGLQHATFRPVQVTFKQRSGLEFCSQLRPSQ